MIWIYAVCATLIYGVLVAFAMTSATAPRGTMMAQGSHPMQASLGIMSAGAAAFGGFCVLFIAQVPSTSFEMRRAPVSEDAAASLAGILDPKDADAVASYLRTPPPQTPISNAMSSLPDVETMISRLEARLEATPTDAKGWKTLAWAYQATGRDDLARSTYAKGLSFNPDDQDLKAAAGTSKAESDVN